MIKKARPKQIPITLVIRNPLNNSWSLSKYKMIKAMTIKATLRLIVITAKDNHGKINLILFSFCAFKMSESFSPFSMRKIRSLSHAF